MLPIKLLGCKYYKSNLNRCFIETKISENDKVNYYKINIHY